ncbi:MAG: hypothetical protein K0U98_18535 [Deltaproteobacteria bacterium]|nr:hypothetical protein [Deltaproteobacteria bacterium]
MIEFVSLFLALVVGEQVVELTASSQVAAIELFLDGQLVQRLEEPPWRTPLDFGEGLQPHELVAISLDATGGSLGEARQWVNFGRGLVEARLSLGNGEDWPPRRARLHWQSFDGSRPLTVKVQFDGQQVEVNNEGAFDLPHYDAGKPHSLEAHLGFHAGLEATAALSFGGVFGERVSSDLTAIPLFLQVDRMDFQVDEMHQWFEASRVPLRVFSLKEGGESIYVIRDLNLPERLTAPLRSELSVRKLNRRKRESDSELYFLGTVPEFQWQGAVSTAIFKPYQLADRWRRRGLLSTLLRQRGPKGRTGQKQRIFDSAAVAGKLAAQSGVARAVLVLLDPETIDHSRLGLQDVAAYMESLRVPFFVWLRPDEAGQAPLENSGLIYSNLGEVATRMAESLDSQFVVWLEGRLLPQQIELTDRAPETVQLIP